MDLETFEKRFKEIIMHASQVMLTKQGDKLPGQIKVEGFKQTSTFTGKPVREIAFMQMIDTLNTLKNMCLGNESHTHEEWEKVLTDNIVASAILYSICPEDGSKAKTAEGETTNVEDKK